YRRSSPRLELRPRLSRLRLLQTPRARPAGGALRLGVASAAAAVDVAGADWRNGDSCRGVSVRRALGTSACARMSMKPTRATIARVTDRVVNAHGVSASGNTEAMKVATPLLRVLAPSRMVPS